MKSNIIRKFALRWNFHWLAGFIQRDEFEPSLGDFLTVADPATPDLGFDVYENRLPPDFDSIRQPHNLEARLYNEASRGFP